MKQVLALALVLVGCSPELPPVVDVGPPDTGPTCTPTDAVDLLFMIDNSGSMLQEQGMLRMEVPRLLTVLADVASLHVGIITSDLGAGDVPAGETVPSCDPGLGDDGIMWQTTRGGPGCEPSYPSRVFEYAGSGEDAAEFSTMVGCVADIGNGGCGFEQQLEVVLKALSPANVQPWVSPHYVPPVFVGPTAGHGDGTNMGFLREESVLVLVLLSDEEDCSVPDYSIFYMNDPVYAGNPLNLRCVRFPDAQYPPSRYVDGFLQLRPSPTRLVYAPIVGIPVDLAGEDYETMLSDRRLEETEEPAVPPQRLLPSCDGADGVAFPPRRMIEVARGLRDAGAYTAVESVCASSYEEGFDRLIETIRRALTCGP